jgi:glycosyltransferase involved in cell wall biosynthesis
MPPCWEQPGWHCSATPLRRLNSSWLVALGFWGLALGSKIPATILVSVIIPTHNRSALLREAVASVLAQEDADLEVIVVNDGSSDDTASLLESFGSAIRTISQPRGGVSSARNAGIRAATREWLAFLDSDDLWLPQKLRTQLAFLRENPEFKICQTEETWIRSGRKLNPKQYHRKPRGYCFPQLLERCLISPSAVVIHRELFGDVGLFDESLPACEDYDLWLRIGYRYPIGLVKEPLTIKRGGHADQLSSTISALDRYRIQALAKLLQHEPLSPHQQELTLQALERKCRIYGEGCRKRGRNEEAESFVRLFETVVTALRPES